ETSPEGNHVARSNISLNIFDTLRLTHVRRSESPDAHGWNRAADGDIFGGACRQASRTSARHLCIGDTGEGHPEAGGLRLRCWRRGWGADDARESCRIRPDSNRAEDAAKCFPPRPER